MKFFCWEAEDVNDSLMRATIQSNSLPYSALHSASRVSTACTFVFGTVTISSFVFMLLKQSALDMASGLQPMRDETIWTEGAEACAMVELSVPADDATATMLTLERWRIAAIMRHTSLVGSRRGGGGGG